MELKKSLDEDGGNNLHRYFTSFKAFPSTCYTCNTNITINAFIIIFKKLPFDAPQ